MLHDPSLPPAGARPVRIPRVVGARWPGETSAMYVVGPTKKA